MTEPCSPPSDSSVINLSRGSPSRSSRHRPLSVLKQVLRSRAFRALAQDDTHRVSQVEMGISSSPFAKRASAVILSAAGAKDLLSPRCEGPALEDDVREQQVLRTRAFRALAQDDTPPRALKKRRMELILDAATPGLATRQVFPSGVPLFNELDLSGADPALDLLPARKRSRAGSAPERSSSLKSGTPLGKTWRVAGPGVAASRISSILLFFTARGGVSS